MADTLDTTQDELIGVTTAGAARVVGVSVKRIVAWEQNQLVRPHLSRQVGARHVRVYRLDDLVELCVVKGLEDKGQPVRNIRRVVDAMRAKNVTHPLRELRWAVERAANGRDRIFVGYDDGSWAEGRRPDQTVMTGVINVEEIRSEARRRARERPADMIGRIEKRSRTLGAKPVFAGTRTPVEAVHAYMRRGLPDSDILEAFPHLGPDDLAVARKRLSA